MTRGIKRIIFWLVAGLVIIGGFLMIIFANTGPVNNNQHIGEVGTDEWMKGNPSAKVTLVEYSDFQCPACKAREMQSKEILGEFGSHIKFVYRHFSWDYHERAFLASQASEAAGIQGKFWEMHDKIFENQEVWSKQSEDAAEESFISYASELKLDVGKFKSDLHSDEVKNEIEKDHASGEEAGINATPSYFLNGTIINPRNYDEFRTLVRDAVEKANKPAGGAESAANK
jgi:protein-disulfide isomerase